MLQRHGGPRKAVKKNGAVKSHRPRLRTLVSSNTVERLREERKCRTRNKKSGLVVVALLAIGALVFAWNAGLGSTVETGVTNGVNAVKTKVTGWIPFKSQVVVSTKNQPSVVDQKGPIAWVKKVLPFGKGTKLPVYAKPMVLVQFDCLHPMGFDGMLQPRAEKGFFDIPLLLGMDYRLTKAGISSGQARFSLDLLDAMQRKTPFLYSKLETVEAVGFNQAILTFSDSPLKVRIGRGASLEEQAINLDLLRKNMDPEINATVNLAYSGIAFVTREE